MFFARAGVLAGQAVPGDRRGGQSAQVRGVDRVLLKRAVCQRVLVVSGPVQGTRGEAVRVQDGRTAWAQVVDVGPQRRGVHRNEHVRPVTGSQDVMAGEMHLEAGHALHRASRCADLGGEAWQRAQVVARRRGLCRETISGELHAVARITGEPDNNAVQLLDLPGGLFGELFGRHGEAFLRGPRGRGRVRRVVVEGDHDAIRPASWRRARTSGSGPWPG